MSATPPRRAERILARALRRDPAAAAILGDLREDYASVASGRGGSAARRWYWREALLLAMARAPRNLLATLAADGVGRDLRLAGRARAVMEDGGYAVRALRRDPASALFGAVVIGVGVGATTAVFSVLKPLMVDGLPLPDPEALVWIENEAPPGNNSLSAVTSRSGNLRDFRERGRGFEGLTGYNAFWAQTAYTLTGGGESERLAGVGVAHDFLEVLGVQPLHGRGFTAQEGLWSGPPAVILSHGFWRLRFDADPGLVGGTLTLNGVPRTVVGVLPPTFDFSSLFSPGVGVDFLLPFPVSDETDRQGNTMLLVGRLRPGVTPEAAQAELDAIVAALEEEQPNRWGLGARVTPMHAHIAGPFRPALLLLAAAAGTVLLIVCVNVSNLLLARSTRRVREMAVRKALGASRGRLMRQLLMESGAVALVGAAVGWALAWVATRVVADTTAVRIPLLDRVVVDDVSLVFGVAVALLTGLVVGLVPALQVREGGEAAVLRAASRGSTTSRSARRLREALVVSEVTLAFVLLVGGALLVRSFRAVLDIDLGFDSDGVVAWQLNPSAEFESLREATDFYARLTARVSQIPGVEAVGLIDALPLGRTRNWGVPALVVGGPEDDDSPANIFPHMIDPGYLPAMRTPLVAGRNFTPYDTQDSPPVVLMNRSGARSVFSGQDALGRRIQLWDDREWEVVGIVKDVRHVLPELGPGIQVYFPTTQMGDFSTLDLVVRSTLPPDRVGSAVAEALRELDASMPTREFWTLRSTVDRAVSARRFTLGILTVYGAVALFLAGLGIYAVLAHSVVERRPEIGIRMALGASAREVVRQVIGRTMLLAAVGVLAGALLSLATARLLESLLYGVSSNDPGTFLGMALVLLAVAAAAAAIPAPRAARIRAVRVLAAD